jgi:hypothetical protein
MLIERGCDGSYKIVYTLALIASIQRLPEFSHTNAHSAPGYNLLLAERPTLGLRRRFQLRVFFLADFETDGFRAQRRLHHVPASSLAIPAETSSRA